MEKPTYSRQRTWQLKMRKKGKCRICAKRVWRKGSGYCFFHKEQDRLRQNAKNALALVDRERKKA